jgi:hypothetical protein
VLRADYETITGASRQVQEVGDEADESSRSTWSSAESRQIETPGVGGGWPVTAVLKQLLERMAELVFSQLPRLFLGLLRDTWTYLSHVVAAFKETDEALARDAEREDSALQETAAGGLAIGASEHFTGDVETGGIGGGDGGGTGAGSGVSSDDGDGEEDAAAAAGAGGAFGGEGAGGSSSDDAGDGEQKGEGEPADDSGSGKGSLPDWLKKKWDEGRAFDRENWHRYPHNEVDLESGKRVDSYNPGREIVERKYTQLSEVKPETAKDYINSLRNKYEPGQLIGDTPKNRLEGIAGDELEGRHILEVPPQDQPVPPEVLRHAAERRVIIRDTNGKVYR